MARPIKGNPIIRGKAAGQIRKMVLCDAVPSAKRIEQNKKDIQVYLSARER